jgi:hypothetical protein
MNGTILLAKLKNSPRMRSFAPWVLIGLMVHLAGFLLFRIEIAPAPELEIIPPFVTWMSADAGADEHLFREQSLLMDTSVLFVPRLSENSELDWNTAERGYALRFRAIEPNIRMDAIESLQHIGLSERYAIAQPEDLMATRFWRLFDRIGFADVSVENEPASPPPGFQIHHWQSASNPLLLDLDDLPVYDERRGRMLAAPAEMVFHVDERGLIGRPVRLTEPRNREFLDSVQLWLTHPSLHYGLAPGTHYIRVFP